MKDQNIFLLRPHILSTTSNKTSNDCLENENLIESKFARFYFSGSKVPQQLLDKVIQNCVENPKFLGSLTENVLNSSLLKSHNIRRQYQVNILKTIISKLEKQDIPVPDDIYNRLGELMGEKDGDQVERIYLSENNKSVLAKFQESSTQLSKGTTGLSVWQASCDLANLCRLLPFDKSKILELGAGCGVSGISIAANFKTSSVILTDYDENVLNLVQKNVNANQLSNCQVVSIDWSNFHPSLKDLQFSPEIIIAADVVYDTTLLPSLCNVISHFLRTSAMAAIIACTLRNPESLEKFENEIEKAGMKIVEKINYENEVFQINEEKVSYPTIFPFSSTLETPTIFYNLQI